MKGIPPQARPVVILCGFMGTGKSAVGSELARLLDVDFIDSDALIESQQGLSVREIFAREGEPRFRHLERQFIDSLDVSHGVVVATGGGMIVNQENFDRLSALGHLVLLEANPSVIAARIGSGADRPVLGDNPSERIDSLLAQRREAYHRIPESHRVDTSLHQPLDAARHVLARTPWSEYEVLIPVDVRELPGADAQTFESRVVIAPGIAERLGRFIDTLPVRGDVFLLSPPRIRELHGARMEPTLRRHSRTFHWLDVEDGDAHKTLAQVESLLDRLAAANAARDSIVVSVGGGVTGDIAGFTAAIYMRGVAFIQVPTTLLAQVDASIGGKTGVNHARAKNIIGAIHQPHVVLSDPRFLETLPARELSAGMAEVIKTAMIGNPYLCNAEPDDDLPPLYRWLREASRRSFGDAIHDTAEVSRWIFECADIKGGIVADDPYERDRRRVLNLGHTLGHALEATLGYSALSHGEAVGLGLLAALRVAVKRGAAEQSYLDDTRELLIWCGLPVETPPFDGTAVRDALALDKKRRGGGMTFVLPYRPGHVGIVDDVTVEELLAAASD